MGRPSKQGIDYWARDIGLFRDPKFRRLKQEFGYLALVVYEELLDIMYGDKGYYIDCRDEAWDDLIWQVSQPLQGKYAPTTETIADVISGLAECRLFSHDQYRRGIITSKRAQEIFFTATLRRTAIEIDFDIWLLTESDMRSLNPSGKSIVLQSFISDSNNLVSASNNSVFASKSTQSKVEESKADKSTVKETIVKDTRVNDSTVEEGIQQATDLTDFSDELENIIHGSIDAGFRAYLKTLISIGMERCVILHAASKTADRNPPNPPPYFRRILQDYERRVIFTIAEVESQTPAAIHSATEQETGSLKPWEQDWLEEVEARKARRLDNGQN